MKLEFYPSEERKAATMGGALAKRYGCHIIPTRQDPLRVCSTQGCYSGIWLRSVSGLCRSCAAKGKEEAERNYANGTTRS